MSRFDKRKKIWAVGLFVLATGEHVVAVIDGNYYDREGNIVSREDYEASCHSTKPKYR